MSRDSSTRKAFPGGCINSWWWHCCALKQGHDGNHVCKCDVGWPNTTTEGTAA